MLPATSRHSQNLMPGSLCLKSGGLFAQQWKERAQQRLFCSRMQRLFSSDRDVIVFSYIGKGGTVPSENLLMHIVRCAW